MTIISDQDQSLIPQEGVKDDITSYLDELKENTFDFDKASIHLRRLVNDWNDEIEETEDRRVTRKIDVDVRELRDQGKLDEDETLIPDRVIDTNILREQPPYINYLKNSRRLAIFTCVSNPNQNTQRIESEFTRGMSYISWEIPHYKCLDGTQTHGWDAIEVTYDEDKPLHVALEHIGHDKLFFPVSCLDIQSAPRVIRAYDVTIIQLKRFVDSFGFSADQVGNIISAIKSTSDEPETVRIYKEFCKYEGKVYVSWFSLQHGVNDWLKAPVPLFLGIKKKVKTMVDVPVMEIDPKTGLLSEGFVKQPQESWEDAPIIQYPIYILPYRETEEPKIMDHKGRVFYDINKQEAQTAVLSGFVNRITRASNIYGSQGVDDGSGSSLSEVQDITLVGGRILNKPVNFFSVDYPDPMVLKAMQWFDVANDVEMNQPNFAAMNREDSRKTAREITAAQQQQQLLNSVQLTLFSTHVRSIYNLVWLIVQSQALQGQIVFLQIEKQRPIINPLTGTPILDEMGQPQMETYWENDYAVIEQTYDIRAAGDVDVVQKQEKIMQMKQDWPVISQTVLRDVFLAELLRLQYPDTGERWSQMLLSQGSAFENMKGLVVGMAGIIGGVFEDNPQILQNLEPQEQQAIQQLLGQAKQLTAGPQNVS